ncbi:bifunctional pyr operon transcriptional regulator/uracil phosphoribosyltransferase PyrR [Isoalcanivorax beigongshangi]|uniref:bifunctional pyr operon transcriptional regulator/uracil phosphoribosyltransferase PyrR n=1 Tax=Isoalcanivorax beigongshangi TaxID=3238810 RepID=UPI003F70BDC1
MTDLSSTAIDARLARMADDLQQHLAARNITDPALVGIHTGGVWVAEELHRRLAQTGPLGTLDISFYRDDFSRRGLHPSVRPSALPFEVENAHIVLVDDVLMSGRTIRAALNLLFDYGRPASITLAVLFDIGRREMPFAADVCGEHLALAPDQRVELRGPAPLEAEILTLKA